MVKKYELVKPPIDHGMRTLYCVRALTNFDDVKAGDYGGFVESEDNLSHDGTCWIYPSATVMGNAVVRDDAKVKSYALVLGYAEIEEHAVVSDHAIVAGEANIYGNAQVLDNVHVFDQAQVFGDVILRGATEIGGHAIVCGVAPSE